jgi:flagellar hook assembly protein FlgD
MVYDVLGRFVRSLMDARLIQGEYRATWDGQNELGSPASSGVYFFQLSIDEARLVRKGILLK